MNPKNLLVAAGCFGLLAVITAGYALSTDRGPMLQARDPFEPTALAIERKAYRPVKLNTFPQTVGNTPLAILVQMFGVQDEFPRTQQLELVYGGGETKRTAIAIYREEGLLDDSVRGQRYRIELVRRPDQRWQITWIGAQSKCWPNRGSQNWSSSLCM